MYAIRSYYADQYAEGAQTVEGLAEGIAPDGVVDRGHPFAASDLPDLCHPVGIAIDEWMITAVGFRQGGLLLRADRANDRSAKMFRPLAGNQVV